MAVCFLIVGCPDGAPQKAVFESKQTPAPKEGLPSADESPSPNLSPEPRVEPVLPTEGSVDEGIDRLKSEAELKREKRKRQRKENRKKNRKKKEDKKRKRNKLKRKKFKKNKEEPHHQDSLPE